MPLIVIGLNDDQINHLVSVLKETGDWSEAKRSLGIADPKMLDENFKGYCHEMAGVDLSDADQKKYATQIKSARDRKRLTQSVADGFAAVADKMKDGKDDKKDPLK